MTAFTDFRFLTPTGEIYPTLPVPTETAEQLHLLLLFTHDPTAYFTADARVIAYRQELLRDMERLPQVTELLENWREQLGILAEMCRTESEDASAETETCVRDLVLLTLYTRLIRDTNVRLADLPLRAEALVRLRELIAQIAEDTDFVRLCENLTRISVDIEQIKSITVGINLDAQLRPREAGVVSIHREYFKSGEWIDRLLRMEIAPTDYTCIAPLAPLSKKLTAQEREQLQNALNGAMNKIMKHSLHRARGGAIRTLRAWCRDLLPLLPELTFLTDARRLMRTWQDAGLPICYPRLSHNGETALEGLYNPHLLRTADPKKIVRNDFAADTRRALILTGPNSGGKTVYTVAVALCYLLTGLGMAIPAARGTLTPATNILVHFPDRHAPQYRMGRFEEECRRLAQLRDQLSGGAAVFMDETFGSTGAEEAATLAQVYLDSLLHADCLCLFSTHLHILARQCAEREGYLTLSAEPNTYRIVPARPGGSSYAEQIAKNYGLL